MKKTEPPLHFEIASIIWGEKYIKPFLDFLVPNYLSPNNIPLTAKHFSIVSHIYTTPEDVELIASHPHYKKLKEWIGAEIFPIIDRSVFTANNKWGIKGYCQSLAIKKAAANQSVILLLNPDSLISDGGLFKCCSLIAEGKKAVVIGELARIEIESILPKLHSFYDSPSQSLTLSNAVLTDLGFQHLHKISQTQFWHGEQFCQWSSIVYWKAGKTSLLAKFFHVHPLAIDLRNVRKDLPTILMPDDGGLIEFLGIRRKDVHQVTDSNEIVCVELSSKDMEIGGALPCPISQRSSSVLKFASKYALSTHVGNFLDFNLRFQGSEEINWEQVEREAETDLKPLRFYLSIIKQINLLKEIAIKYFRIVAISLGARRIKRFLLKRT